MRSPSLTPSSSSDVRAVHVMLSWLIITALGSPVVPEV